MAVVDERTVKALTTSFLVWPHDLLAGFMLEPPIGRRSSASTFRVDYPNDEVSTLLGGVLNFVVIAVAEIMGR